MSVPLRPGRREAFLPLLHTHHHHHAHTALGDQPPTGRVPHLFRHDGDALEPNGVLVGRCAEHPAVLPSEL